MIAHYPGNMDCGGKVRGQETASGSARERLPIPEGKRRRCSEAKGNNRLIEKLNKIWTYTEIPRRRECSNVDIVGVLKACWGESL